MMHVLTSLIGIACAILSTAHGDQRWMPCFPSVPQSYSVQFDYQIDDSIESFTTHAVLGENSATGQISGLAVVLPADPHGCSEQSYSQNLLSVESELWLALVARGICTFDVKSEHALQAGASALVVFQSDEGEPIPMSQIRASNVTHLMINMADGHRIVDIVYNGTTQVFASIVHTNIDSATERESDTGNEILLIVTLLVAPVAFLMNLIALLAMCCYPEKPKPYLYLIGNLILTDLFVCVVGTAMILVVHPKFGGNILSEESEIMRDCAASLLDDLWSVCLFSNLLTLFNLTAEHFIAFRWPLKHRVMVTKQRVRAIIAFSWLLSFAPMIFSQIEDALVAVDDTCYQQSFCHRSYYLDGRIDFGWQHSLIWILVVSLVFVTMMLVYGYILSIIYRVSLRNPGFRKRRAAVVTTLCLVVSFALSYIFYYFQNMTIVIEKHHATEFGASAHKLFTSICPACPLMLDYLLTGMIGAIMDPVIYCIRMKEVKTALRHIFRGKTFTSRNSTTSTAYPRGNGTPSTAETEETI